MLKNVVIAVAVVIVSLLLYASTKPDTFEVKRSIVVNATASEVFLYVNDFHNWASWSPWEKLDPAMKRTFSGAATGVGAVYAWEGNDDVGQGRMEITRVAIPNLVRIRLDFIKPFQARNITEFIIDDQGDHTAITWTMSGENKPINKLMQVFVDMESMIGKDFEAGLANLKALSEQ